MAKLLGPVVPTLILLLGIVPVVALVYWWRRNNRLHSRQSPLARNLLRPPGHSLRKKIEDFDAEIDLHFIGIVLVPSLLYSIVISQFYFWAASQSGWSIGIYLLLGLAFVAVVGKRLLRLMNERKYFALGLDGELATAEELNQLMRDGCRVFHDVPIRYGNVDHVVVHRSGVYAVNTKLLGRLPQNGNDAQMTVDYERNVLRFPDRVVPIPVDQLTREAKCLSEELTSAVGQAITAEPMLALPGWFINRSGRGQPCVFSPRNSTKFFVHSRHVLTGEAVKQVVYQLEKLCRDVEPVFQEKKGWDSGK